MRTYRKYYNCSEAFPVEAGDTWVVKEGRNDKAVERWTCVKKHAGSFMVEIIEYVPVDRSSL